jgi:hypothetical protein
MGHGSSQEDPNRTPAARRDIPSTWVFRLPATAQNKLGSAPASATRIRCSFRGSTDVGYIDKRIVAAAVGTNSSASSLISVAI